MEYLFLAAVIFAVFNSINAECDEKSAKALYKCYDVFTTAVKSKSSVVNKTFCKNLHEQIDCLKESAKGCSSKPSLDELSKILKTDKISVMKIFFIEVSYKYVCSHPYEATKEEEKCLAEISDKDVDCGFPEHCPDMEKYLICYKKALDKKCKNEEISKIYTDAAVSAFKTLLPKCL